MLELGDVVGGRWRLIGELGQGGFGQVYRAEDASEVGLGTAALKVLLPSTSQDEQEHFLGEVQKVAQLRHPNLVAYLDSGRHQPPGERPRSYLVTELCDYTLSDVLKERPGNRMEPAEVAEVVKDLAAGLTYLQRRGLLHRDIKASNIMHGEDGWKLGDFGLTRSLTTTGHYHQTGEVIGTPHYMAPELFSAALSSQASDVYALGVLVHQALTGRYPYEGADIVALVGQISSQEPTFDPSLDPHWRWFITALMQRDPGDRLTVDQLVSVLPKTAPAPAASPPVGWLPDPPHDSRPPPPRRDPRPAPPVDSRPAPPPVSPQVPHVDPRPAPPVSQPVPQHVSQPVSQQVPPHVAQQPVWPHSYSPSVARMATTSSDYPTQYYAALDSAGSRPRSMVLTGVLAVLALGTLAVIFWAVALRPGSSDALAGLTPEERVAAVLATEVDGPTGYQFEVLPPPDTSDLCVGVERPEITVDNIARESVEFADAASRHTLTVSASVFASDEIAQQYVAARQQALSRCDGQPLFISEIGVAGSTVNVYEVPKPVDVPGADEVLARSWTFTDGPNAYPENYGINARFGDLVVNSSGTDLATVEYYAQLAAARVLGEDEPAKVEPTGVAEGR